MNDPLHYSRDELVSGALESAFWAMDRLILRDKQKFRISGGSCALGNTTVPLLLKLKLRNINRQSPIVFTSLKKPLSLVE